MEWQTDITSTSSKVAPGHIPDTFFGTTGLILLIQLHVPSSSSWMVYVCLSVRGFSRWGWSMINTSLRRSLLLQIASSLCYCDLPFPYSVCIVLRLIKSWPVLYGHLLVGWPWHSASRYWSGICGHIDYGSHSLASFHRSAIHTLDRRAPWIHIVVAWFLERWSIFSGPSIPS